MRHIANIANGDARAALNAVELAALTTERGDDGRIHIDLSAAEECIQKRAVNYEKKGENHYDTISAFIKSMRGSDPDAVLHYLAKMLYAGEDPKFIARRIMICASEDVGNADPNAIVVAAAAANAQLYADNNSGLTNEFASMDSMKGKTWRFQNFTVEDFVWHQRRKYIYGLYDDRKSSGRIIKAEFEPVKAWDEIKNEYDPNTRVKQRGWVKLKAQVTMDDDGPFIPSVYGIEPLDVLSGPREALEVARVFSYMEEFRQQVQRDETAIVEGNLEEVESPNGSFLQVTLTYCPRYYEQVLKALH
jgi:hypothetical protein